MKYEAAHRLIVSEVSRALDLVDPESAESLADAVCSAEKVFVVGVGRVLLMLQAFVKRLNHLGVEANFVGAVDEPAITEKDLLLVGSGSGESAVPLAIAKIAKRYGAKIARIGSNADSSMKQYEDLLVRIPCRTKLNRKDEINSKQPMSSLFEQSLLLLLDSEALMIAERRNIGDMSALWHRHANLE
ncbi:MAG: SIS domain-containing protein [Oscillospiraceae bacterium]|jgi:6-phospho-3-hexuloisomerase|nr:SIS domain-containing protein [Oscillospiraceae bacterium]MCI1991522.1 SIS domain-containing protein [Oscillospiraceae bacterium]MCI2034430.1 SIS domain-containing protein [Oscillospiraceae bacterium]